MIKKKIVQFEINDYSDLTDDELEEKLLDLALTYTIQKDEVEVYRGAKELVNTMIEVVDISEILTERKNKKETSDEENK